MSTIQPEGEDLRKAIKYLSELKQDEPDLSITALVEQVCVKFNLSPKDAEYLTRFLQEGGV